MMEQLAERRMHREEQAAYSAAMGQSSIPNHTHAPSMDQEQYAEDEDDYDSAEDEEEEFDDEMVNRSPDIDHSRLKLFRSNSPRTSGWRKDVACSKSSPLACSSKGY